MLDEYSGKERIKHYLAGNLCRCGTYPEVIEAVKLVRKRTAGVQSRDGEAAN